MTADTRGPRPETRLVAAGRPSEPGAPLNVPPVPASNFILGGEASYARGGDTPTWTALEAIVGTLEGGEAVAFASGMAAAAAVFADVPSGALIAIPDDCYHGVAALADAGRERHGWRVHRVPVDDAHGWIAAAGEADLVWLESPSNPLLVVADLAAICAAPRRAGAVLAVDNTFATPLNQQPLGLGADVSMQSATKFIGGHSDLLAGVLTTSRLDLLERFREARTLHGATPGALEAFLAARGARSLAVRLERAQDNAARLAAHLREHPAVERVRYPGLPDHPTHAVAAAQLGGFGTMISFDVRGGAEAADAVCRGARIVHHATSLGAVESTMERRAAVRGQDHLPPSLIRLSVGIEAFEDLRDDLDRALTRAAG